MIANYNEFLNESLKGYTKDDIIKKMNDEGGNKSELFDKLMDKYPDTANDMIDNLDIKSNKDKVNIVKKIISKMPEYAYEVVDKLGIDKEYDREDKDSLLSLLIKADPSQFREFAMKLRGDDLELRDKYYNLYVFLETQKYKEVEIEGEVYHKKMLGFEQLLKIDLYEPSSLNNISGMKMRAMFQAEVELHGVYVPKDMLDDDRYNDSDSVVEDKYIMDYINKNKFRIR